MLIPCLPPARGAPRLARSVSAPLACGAPPASPFPLHWHRLPSSFAPASLPARLPIPPSLSRRRRAPPARSSPAPGRGDDLARRVDVRQPGQPTAGERRLLALEAVDPVPDMPDGRRGDVRAEPRVGDHHDHHVLRVVTRAERGEHRGRQLADDLGRAGLAGHAHLAEREAPERPRRRARRQHPPQRIPDVGQRGRGDDRKSTRLNSSHVRISYAVFCLKKKQKKQEINNIKKKKKKNKKRKKRT